MINIEGASSVRNALNNGKLIVGNHALRVSDARGSGVQHKKPYNGYTSAMLLSIDVFLDDSRSLSVTAIKLDVLQNLRNMKKFVIPRLICLWVYRKWFLLRMRVITIYRLKLFRPHSLPM